MKATLTAIFTFLILQIGSSQRLQTPTLSPYTKTIQEVGLTEIEISYSRPSAKGRKIFGGLVPYGKIWRTGANASTQITVHESVLIGGIAVDSGTYALYTIPGQQEWTVILHGNTRLRSLAGESYKPEQDIGRFAVSPSISSDFVETFTLQFGDLSTYGMNLILSWENTVVRIPIVVRVDEKIENQMAKFLATGKPLPHRTYFEAAQFYLHNNKNLSVAMEWINEALGLSPENFRYGLLKSKIWAASGNLSEAISTVKEANAWAIKANNANYTEQTELYLAELKAKTKE